MAGMGFTVLLCTYDRHELLRQALQGLTVDTTEKPDQVVVVNGGDERADKVVSDFSGVHTVEVTLVKTENKNLAASRNVGMAHCKGDIVAMTDDDAIVFPDWVTQMKQVHAAHPEAGAVGGSVIGAESKTSFLSRLSDTAVFPSKLAAGPVNSIAGVNVSYKRVALDAVGKQDETLVRGEDVDFNWRLKKLGYVVWYDPAIKVTHVHRTTFGKLVDQFHMYGHGYYMVRQKWPDMYCVYPHRINNLRSVLKGINFLIGPFYWPIAMSRGLQNWLDRLAALPLLTVCQLAWHFGVITQMMS